jgi:5-methylcytosine-specific restriction endonuclease McrA
VSYQTNLQSPRWQRKRLEIMGRDDFVCLRCGRPDLSLEVHHRSYHLRPWDCPEFDLETLCRDHHNAEHARQPDGGPTLFTLRQMIARAHSVGNWDEVWRLCHLREFEEC